MQDVTSAEEEDEPVILAIDEEVSTLIQVEEESELAICGIECERDVAKTELKEAQTIMKELKKTTIEIEGIK